MIIDALRGHLAYLVDRKPPTPASVFGDMRLGRLKRPDRISANRPSDKTKTEQSLNRAVEG
jgi:hypothetical protein